MQSKNTEGNIIIKRKLRQSKRNDLLPHSPMTGPRTELFEFQNPTVHLWRSETPQKLESTYLIWKLSRWSKMRLSWVILADELFFLTRKTDKATGNLEQDLHTSAVIFMKMQYRGDTESIVIFWKQRYTHILAEQKNGCLRQMVVENWQEQLRAEEGSSFFPLLLKCFSVIKQYASLDIISVQWHVLRPQKVRHTKKFLGFKSAALEKSSVDHLSE